MKRSDALAQLSRDHHGLVVAQRLIRRSAELAQRGAQSLLLLAAGLGGLLGVAG